MKSFLIDCPQCGVMIAKDMPCPECQWVDQGDDSAEKDRLTMQLFSRRMRIHKRNYAVFMILTLATGLIGMLTAVMWALVIYRGSLIALVGVGLMTVLSGVLAVLLFCSKKLFPTELYCPACDIQLDQLGTIGAKCPSCYAQLKNESAYATEPTPEAIGV